MVNPVDRYVSAGERLCDLDLWPMTLKAFPVLPTHMWNICVKFYSNLSTKYGDIASRETGVNGQRTNGQMDW